MLESATFVFLLVFIALLFDFLNGFHDAANSISTVVSTCVLSPKIAVISGRLFLISPLFFLWVPRWLTL